MQFKGQRVDGRGWVSGDLVNHPDGRKSIVPTPARKGYGATEGFLEEVVPDSITSQMQEDNAKMRKALSDASDEFDRLAELDCPEYVHPEYSVLEWEGLDAREAKRQDAYKRLEAWARITKAGEDLACRREELNSREKP